MGQNLVESAKQLECMKEQQATEALEAASFANYEESHFVKKPRETKRLEKVLGEKYQHLKEGEQKTSVDANLDDLSDARAMV